MLVIAHAVVGRTDLPIPEWLFGWAAAVVLVVSFVALAVLWPEPRLQDGGFRPLPTWLSRALTNRVTDVLCSLIGVGLLGLVVYTGFKGVQLPQASFAVAVRVRGVLDRSRGRQRAVRRHLPGLEPVAGAGPVRGLDLADGRRAARCPPR